MAEVEEMSQATSPSAGQKYGLVLVCQAWGITRSMDYVRKASAESAPGRRGPVGFHTYDELLDHIAVCLQSSPFTDEGYRKVWARLRFDGIRTSPQRTLSLMRENNLLAVRSPDRPHGPKAHDGTIKTTQVDEMWGTDMTTTMAAREGNASIFLAVDHCSLNCVGIHAAKCRTRFEALEPIGLEVRLSFGAFGPEVAKGLTLRHDNGSQYVFSVFQEEISFLGIQSYPSFVRESQVNGIAERFVRTLKENLLWIQRFDTVEELLLALLEFKDTYNREWIIGRHDYKTPAAVRAIQKEAVNVAA